jgi:hypothetical protein
MRQAFIPHEWLGFTLQAGVRKNWKIPTAISLQVLGLIIPET